MNKLIYSGESDHVILCWPNFCLKQKKFISQKANESSFLDNVLDGSATIHRKYEICYIHLGNCSHIIIAISFHFSIESCSQVIKKGPLETGTLLFIKVGFNTRSTLKILEFYFLPISNNMDGISILFKKEDCIEYSVQFRIQILGDKFRNAVFLVEKIIAVCVWVVLCLRKILFTILTSKWTKLKMFLIITSKMLDFPPISNPSDLCLVITECILEIGKANLVFRKEENCFLYLCIWYPSLYGFIDPYFSSSKQGHEHQLIT